MRTALALGVIAVGVLLIHGGITDRSPVDTLRTAFTSGGKTTDTAPLPGLGGGIPYGAPGFPKEPPK